MNSFYSEEELRNLGLKSYGKNVLISRKCSIYGAGEISLGSNVRIDDFCILSGKINFGNYVHVAAYASLFAGSAGITMEDYSCVSSRCAVYAVSDDYSGETMANSTVPDEFKNVTSSEVVLGKYTLIGTGSTVLPGVTVGEGVSVGAMSLINKSLEPWGMYVGIPCHFMKNRSKKILELEEQFRKSDLYNL